MSLSETKCLIRKHRIFPNKVLGQNFIVDSSIFPRLAHYASLNMSDVVLDIGSGFGFLTRFLSSRCNRVIAIEKDNRIARVLHEQLNDVSNVQLIEGDVMKVNVPDFNKVVSIPPYDISSHLLLWLFNRQFDCAVLIFQKEFGERLSAQVGTENYSWMTVLAHYNAQVDVLDFIPRDMFFPQPEVDSIIVRLTKHVPVVFGTEGSILFQQMLRFLFASRNKKVANALTPFVKSVLKVPPEEVKEIVCSIPFREKRVRTLVPEEFGALANALLN